MGDSSECFSSAHDSRLQKYESLEYIDGVGDSGGEDSGANSQGWHANDSRIKSSPGITNSKNVGLNGDRDYPGDFHIQMEDGYNLNKPVPPIYEPTGAEGTSLLNNGCNAFEEKEPILSQSMIRGKEANGFDEAAQVEGSEEDVQTSSSSRSQDSSVHSDSESWCAEDITDDESKECVSSRDRGIHSSSDIQYQRLTNEDDQEDTKDCETFNGQTNVHRKLYSGLTDRSEDYIGYGENSISYNYPTRSGNNNVYSLDTSKNMRSTSNAVREPIDKQVPLFPSNRQTSPISYSHYRPLASPSYHLSTCGVGSGLSVPLPTTSRSPMPSSSIPAISGSSLPKARRTLPYESPMFKNPPFGYEVDQQKICESAVTLISPQTDNNGLLRGMPKPEPITVDDAESTATATSGNDAETAKKKKKKKRRTGGTKGDSSEVSDKKNVNPIPALNSHICAAAEDGNPASQVGKTQVATYPPTNDNVCGTPIMDNLQRSKAGRPKAGKNKKKGENIIKAREIAGNRGSDDIDNLVVYVEGKKKASAADKGKAAVNCAVPQEKKTKKQKVGSRSFATESLPAVGQGNSETSMARIFEVLPDDVKSGPLSVTADTTFESVAPSDHEELPFDKGSASANLDADVPKESSEVPSSAAQQLSQNEPDGIVDKSNVVLPESSEVTTELDTRETSISTGNDRTAVIEKVDSPVVISSGPQSTPTAAELEFTNFEGLVETAEEVPFEKYVGRKKKPRQPMGRQQQGPSANSPYIQQRGPRWPGQQPQQQPHQSHYNRGHGNGYNNGTPNPYGHGNSKIYPNQAPNRYPSSSNFPPYGPKQMGGTPGRVVPHQQTGGDPRKSTGGSPATQRPASSISSTVSSASTPAASVAMSSGTPTVTSASVVSSAVKSPPPKEEFPPLRPTATVSTSESALPGKKGGVTSPNPASASVTPVIRASQTNPSSSGNGTATTTVVTSATCASGSRINSDSSIVAPSPAGDSESFRAKVNGSVADSESHANNASVSATPRDDIKCDTLEKHTWNFFQVQQFLEQLYPKENEMCNFYSDAGKRAHYSNVSTSSSGRQ